MRLLVCALVVVATATAAFAQQPKVDPKQAAIHSKQAKAYFDTRQYDEAIVEFKKAYDLDPKPVTLFKIASAYYAKADYQGAIDYYAKYLQNDPDGPLAQQALDFTAVAKKELDAQKAKADAEAKAKADAEAKQRADAEAEKKRVAAQAHIKQAEAFAQAGAWVGAGDEYRAAADAGDNPDFLIEAGAAYAKQPDNEKARAAYQDYLAKVPLGGKSDEMRGKVAELTRAIDKAVADRAAEDERQRQLALKAQIAARPEEEPAFELAASLAPGVKLHGDNPFVVALRAEAALRIGRRVNLGVYAEYARISTSGSCGTELPGPEPATDYDFGPRGQAQSCSYVMPGLQLFIHILPKPKHELDPYLGLTPGFRFGFMDYKKTFDMMSESQNHTFIGIQLGFRAGLTYHLSPGAHAWTVGGFVEGVYQVIGDDEAETISSDNGRHDYWSVFIGGRSTVLF
jgi:hypothetical protein